MQEAFKEHEVKDIMPTPKEIKDSFNNKVNPTQEAQEEQKGFWEIFNEFVAECGKQNNWTDSTYEKFAAVKNHIKEFKASQKRLLSSISKNSSKRGCKEGNTWEAFSTDNPFLGGN